MTKFTKEELGDFMNAETARHNSMLPQLRRCFKEIEEAVNAGSEETTVIFVAVYPEVAEALIEMDDRLSLMMDLDVANKQFNLRLTELLEADNFNFTHDILGIQNNIDRKTKTFINCFVPRFAN